MYWKAEVPERRQYPRVNTTMSIQYRGIRQAGDSVIGAIARDISSGGIRVLVNEFISVFTRLIVEICIPSTSESIRVVSKVAWIQKRPHGEQYEVGIQFMDMAEEDRSNIAEFVERSIPKQ
jgi:c-di-GMP-binding flagellar brake protein YcgR